MDNSKFVEHMEYTRGWCVCTITSNRASLRVRSSASASHQTMIRSQLLSVVSRVLSKETTGSSGRPVIVMRSPTSRRTSTTEIISSATTRRGTFARCSWPHGRSSRRRLKSSSIRSHTCSGWTTASRRSDVRIARSTQLDGWRALTARTLTPRKRSEITSRWAPHRNMLYGELVSSSGDPTPKLGVFYYRRLVRIKERFIPSSDGILSSSRIRSGSTGSIFNSPKTRTLQSSHSTQLSHTRAASSRFKPLALGLIISSTAMFWLYPSDDISSHNRPFLGKSYWSKSLIALRRVDWITLISDISRPSILQLYAQIVWNQNISNILNATSF